MNVEQSVIDIEKKGLRWFGHLVRMEQKRWPRRIFRWNPEGRRKGGRPRRNWYGSIQSTMAARNLQDDYDLDRESGD
ncbi:hypothetical protein C0J52_17883 [Blattella germanica]|nr:hypothetical protein C0J52_28389 [Blattella germanica]PSN51576.1 hypothetical protein C0J52_17883 [Blattella germanica]